MKQVKHCTRLLALLLALALLLTGCGTPARDNSTESSSETVTPSEATPTAPTEESSTSPDPAEEPVPLSDEEARLLAMTGDLVEDEVIEISAEDGEQINRTVAGMWKGYVAGPNGEDPLVKSRDWDQYTSTLGLENLSGREVEFFQRLDKVCKKYLTTSGVDGTKHTYDNGDYYYATEGVRFSDLNLSKRRARDLYEWFRYNHPQYYFLYCYALSDSEYLWPCMYETMADAEDRAGITNELFDKLEDWVAQVQAGGSTTYEWEYEANKLICIENEYKKQYEKPPEGGFRYDQSLYSSVLLGSTVCAGFAMAFTAIMNALEIDTTAGLSEGHAWNVVRCDDGQCYAVDVCWNNTDSTPPYKTEYLNIGERIMFAENYRKESHTYQEDFAAWIPAISQEDYDPSQEDPQRYAAPQNVRVQEVNSTYVTLVWDDAADAKWYVATCTATGQSQEPTYQRPSGTSYTFTNLSPDTEYTVSVRCVYSNPSTGESVSSPWTELSVTTAAEAIDRTVDPPTGVKTVRGTWDDEAETSWDALGGYINAEVCQYTDASFTQMMEEYPKEANSPYDRNTWTGLEEGKTYYFGVRAVDQKDRNAPIYSDWVNFSYTHTSAS